VICSFAARTVDGAAISDVQGSGDLDFANFQGQFVAAARVRSNPNLQGPDGFLVNSGVPRCARDPARKLTPWRHRTHAKTNQLVSGMDFQRIEINLWYAVLCPPVGLVSGDTSGPPARAVAMAFTGSRPRPASRRRSIACPRTRGKKVDDSAHSSRNRNLGLRPDPLAAVRRARASTRSAPRRQLEQRLQCRNIGSTRCRQCSKGRHAEPLAFGRESLLRDRAQENAAGWRIAKIGACPQIGAAEVLSTRFPADIRGDGRNSWTSGICPCPPGPSPQSPGHGRRGQVEGALQSAAPGSADEGVSPCGRHLPSACEPRCARRSGKIDGWRILHETCRRQGVKQTPCQPMPWPIAVDRPGRQPSAPACRKMDGRADRVVTSDRSYGSREPALTACKPTGWPMFRVASTPKCILHSRAA